MSHRPLSRRALLRGLGGTALALPLLDAMRGSGAYAQAAKPPKRLLVWYTPNGTVPSNFWPSGGERDFTLSPILSPLERHREQLLIVKGVDMLSALKGPGDAHQKGTGQCLTATELQEGHFSGDAGSSAGWANGPSVDQVVAQELGQSTRFPSVELGVLALGSTVKSRISYRGPGQPLPPENDPRRAYARLFGDPDADPAVVERENRKRRAVLDLVSSQYRRLKDKLGSDDRLKLDIHLASIADLKARLDKVQTQYGGACQPLDLSAPDATRVSNLPEIGRLQMDLLTLAFACDLTRVSSLMWSYSAADYIYDWLGDDVRDGHHSLAHKGDHDSVKVEQNTRINAWYAEQFGYLLDKLQATPDGEGNLLDNTLVLWTNEQSKGNNHDRSGMPYVLAGSCGGHFETGRFVTQTSEVGHGRLLVSVLQAMGVETETFGNPEYGKGALPQLTG